MKVNAKIVNPEEVEVEISLVASVGTWMNIRNIISMTTDVTHSETRNFAQFITDIIHEIDSRISLKSENNNHMCDARHAYLKYNGGKDENKINV